MKLLIFLAFLACVVAGPVQKGPIVIFTPEKLVVISNPKSQENKEPSRQNSHAAYNSGYNRQQYWPESDSVQVAQYIAYQIQQAQQNGYTATQFATYLTKQGFPQSVANYFAEWYEASKNQPSERSPYQIFQYYYEQDIPQEAQKFIAQQIVEAYRQYQQYVLQYGQEAWKQEFLGVPKSVAQYVTQEAKYYSENGVSYPAAQYAYQQLLQAQQYAQNVLQKLEQSTLPQQVDQYISQLLHQGLQYVQDAQKVYQLYQAYQQYYVPYYAAQNANFQIQQANHYFEKAYEYIKDEQAQGAWPQSAEWIFQQVEYAWKAIRNAYQTYQLSQYGQNYFDPESYSTYAGYEPKSTQEYKQSCYQAFQQIYQYIDDTQQYLENREDFPQASYIAEQLTQAYKLYQVAQKMFQQGYQSQPIVEYAKKQVLQAQQFLINAYFVAKQQEDQYVAKNLQYALYCAQYLQYGGEFSYDFGNQYWQGNRGTFNQQYAVQYLQKALQYVDSLKLAIQKQVELGYFSQTSTNYVFDQLEHAQQYLQKALETAQQGYGSHFSTEYFTLQIQQALQCFHKTWQYVQQQEAQGYLPQYAVQCCQRQLQFIVEAIRNAYPASEWTPSAFNHYGYQYGSSYGYGYDSQKPYQFAQYAYQPYQREQYYGEKYPNSKQSYVWDLIQKYFKKNSHYPSKYEYQEQDQTTPYSKGYEYYKPYSTSTSQYKPTTSSAYGNGFYSSPASKYASYGQHQYESYGPYKYGYYKPYGYGSFGPYQSYTPYEYQRYNYSAPQYSSYGQYQYGSSSPFQYQYYGPYEYRSYEPYQSYSPYKHGSYKTSTPQYGSYGQYQQGFYGPYQRGFLNKYGSFGPYQSYTPYDYKPYNYSAPQYGSYGQYLYGSYSPYQYQYNGPYEYESYEPYNFYSPSKYESYKTSAPQYGGYGQHQQGFYGQYQHGSFKPYQSYEPYEYKSYKTYLPQDNSYGQYQYGSYKPYQYQHYEPSQYGSYGSYQSYTPYKYGSFNQKASPYMESSAQVPATALTTTAERGVETLSKPGEVEQAVKDAIDIGYRHIDCAFAYSNEKEVGAALKAKFADGTVKREDIWITSKLWNTYHRPDLVEKNVRMTLNDLGLSYLDLYLIHWPTGYKEDGESFPKDAEGNILFSDVDYLDTWKAMEDLVKKGLVKSIGVSNFNKAQITRVLENATVKPAVLQIECHPYLNQTKLIDFAKSKGIAVTAYSPLGSPDRPWAKPGDPQLMDDPKLIELAKKYKKSPAQVLLRYQLDRGIITIPKSVTKSRIQQNFEIFDFSLSPEDISYLNTFDVNGRLCPLAAGYGHKYHPFEHDEY